MIPKNPNLSGFVVTEEIRKKLQNKKWLKKQFSEGKTGQEVLGFSNEAMANFYRAAYEFFVHKRYEEAANAFLFLVTLNPHHHDYWLGLGMATQMCCDYEDAIDAYEIAAICKLDSPVPYFYLAKCLFAVHDRDSSLEALNLAIEYSGLNPEYAELKQQALAAKALILEKP